MSFLWNGDLNVGLLVEDGTVVYYLWGYRGYIHSSGAGLPSHAKPIQARLSGDSTQMPTL